MNSGDPFQYPPLIPRVRDAIRLLILQPALDIDAIVECDLISTTLSKCNDDVVDHYSALSYVWGDSSDKKTIFVDGKPFHVTANLDSALRHMRDTSRTRKVWADAICINQANHAEKSQQVRQMGDVYESARHTIIFLGEATEETDFLLSYVRQDRPYYPKFTSSTTSDADREKLLDWSSIFSRPWFTRVWVYQELVFSEDPWLQCGAVRARWNQVRSTLESICDSLDIHLTETDVFYSMDRQRTAFRKRDDEYAVPEADIAVSLLDILDSRRGMGVSDPRDMLFAHLGIITTWIRDPQRLLDVDYNKNQCDVFNDLARYLLENAKVSQPLDLLTYVESSNPCESNFASWAPDWTTKSMSHPYCRLRGAISAFQGALERGQGLSSGREAVYNVFSGLAPEPHYAWATPSVLTCVGYQIGAIKEVSPLITNPLPPNQRVPFPITFRDLSDFLDRGTEEQCREAIYRNWQELLKSCPNEAILESDKSHEYQQDPDNSFRSARHVQSADVVFDQEGDNENGIRSRWLKFLSGHLRRPLFSAEMQLSLCASMPLGNKVKTLSPNMFYGRRLALLGNGALCLVPPSARVGDITCCFTGDMRMQYTLRPKTIDERRRHVIDTKIRGNIGEYGSVGISHFELVGESLVEGWLFGAKLREFGIQILQEKLVQSRADSDKKSERTSGETKRRHFDECHKTLITTEGCKFQTFALH